MVSAPVGDVGRIRAKEMLVSQVGDSSDKESSDDE